MSNVMHSIIVAFKEILSWHTIKYVLISGFFVVAIWGVIGYLAWDNLVSLSSHIIELVPFAMVRSNGAWMLSSFLWLQLVLITFALIYAFFGNMILRTVSKERYSAFSIFTLITSAFVWAIVWYFEGDYIYSQFLRLLTWLPFETVEKGVASLIAFYIIYNAIIVTMLFITSLFSEPLISAVEKKHFQESEVVRDNLFRSIGFTVKDTVIFLVVSTIAFPLLFIPVVNIVVQVILWVWLIKDTISFDALSLTRKKVQKEELKEHKFAVWFISFVAALFNFVPILNLFSPYFGEIAMFHYFKSLKQ